MRYERPENIERQLEHDRAALEDTIDAIQRRLSPGQLVDQALGYVRSGGSEVATSVARSAQQNPWPLVLTGVGLAWLMQSTAASRGRIDYREASEFEPGYRRDAIERARNAAAAVQRWEGEAESAFQERVTEARARALELTRNAGETAEAFKERVESYYHRAEEAVTRLRERAGATVDRGTRAIGEGARAVQERAGNTGARLRDAYVSEPLIAGAVAVAAGALLGALFPPTEAEKRLIGEYGGRLREKAGDLASDAAERAKLAAAEGARAAAEAVEDVARGERRESTERSPGELAAQT